MTGAIEFMQAWCNICDKHVRCRNCPIVEVCPGYVYVTTDDDITELVRAVMAETRKKVDAE